MYLTLSKSPGYNSSNCLCIKFILSMSRFCLKCHWHADKQSDNDPEKCTLDEFVAFDSCTKYEIGKAFFLSCVNMMQYHDLLTSDYEDLTIKLGKLGQRHDYISQRKSNSSHVEQFKTF